MSDAYLELSINSIIVRLERFLNDALPRIDADVGDGRLAYTASGNIVYQGENHENFSIWNVEAVVTAEQYQNLRLIWYESEYRRRTNGNPNILVVDTTQQHEERSPRTRALAPSTTATTVSPYVIYYAQYYAVMQAKPEFRILGKGYSVQFTLQETTKTTP